MWPGFVVERVEPGQQQGGGHADGGPAAGLEGEADRAGLLAAVLLLDPALARSRGIRVALTNYLFIVLLALIVNFSIRAVGMLIINALLVVLAAAAANLSRNVRRMVVWSVAGSVGCGLVGYRICWNYKLAVAGEQIDLYPGGTIALLLVGWFLASVFAARVTGRRVSGVASCDC